MPDYAKSKVYILQNSANEIAYIGSTVCELSKRMGEHRSNTKQPEKMNRPLYVAMREIGIQNFWITLLEEYPCENKNQLHKREGWHIQNHDGELYNLCVAGRDAKMYREEPANKEKAKEYMKNYNSENVENIKEKAMMYRKINADKITKNKQIYYATPAGKRCSSKGSAKYNAKPEVKAAKHTKYEKNKEAVLAQQKAWRELNKGAISARNRAAYAAKKAAKKAEAQAAIPTQI